MITMAQRIEELRTEKGLSRPALSAALGFPKTAAEKFETGRATPTAEQQKKMADFFGVSLFYLKGESNDKTRQETWMEPSLSAPPPSGPCASRPSPRAAGTRAPSSALCCAPPPSRTWCGRRCWRCSAPPRGRSCCPAPCAGSWTGDNEA